MYPAETSNADAPTPNVGQTSPDAYTLRRRQGCGGETISYDRYLRVVRHRARTTRDRSET